MDQIREPHQKRRCTGHSCPKTAQEFVERYGGHVRESFDPLYKKQTEKKDEIGKTLAKLCKAENFSSECEGAVQDTVDEIDDLEVDLEKFQEAQEAVNSLINNPGFNEPAPALRGIVKPLQRALVTFKSNAEEKGNELKRKYAKLVADLHLQNTVAYRAREVVVNYQMQLSTDEEAQAKVQARLEELVRKVPLLFIDSKVLCINLQEHIAGYLQSLFPSHNFDGKCDFYKHTPTGPRHILKIFSACCGERRRVQTSDLACNLHYTAFGVAEKLKLDEILYMVEVWNTYQVNFRLSARAMCTLQDVLSLTQ